MIALHHEILGGAVPGLPALLPEVWLHWTRRQSRAGAPRRWPADPGLATAQAALVNQQLPADLAFSRNVHQCVFPGGTLLSAIRAGEPFWRLVYRVTAPVEPRQRIGTFQPADLNYTGVIAVGHGRGVSVAAGFAEQVETVFVLIAALLITGLDVLYRVRRDLFKTLQEAAEHANSMARARALITHLSDRLNDMQLDLGFGVEQYLDSILIPEYIIEAYQRSMSEALGLRTGLQDSSRMLDRLGSVIQARRTALDAAARTRRIAGTGSSLRCSRWAPCWRYLLHCCCRSSP